MPTNGTLTWSAETLPSRPRSAVQSPRLADLLSVKLLNSSTSSGVSASANCRLWQKNVRNFSSDFGCVSLPSACSPPALQMAQRESVVNTETPDDSAFWRLVCRPYSTDNCF